MQTCDTIDDRESDSHTFIRTSTSLIYSVEFLFYEHELILRDASAIIRKGDDVFFLGFLIGECKSSIRPGILDEVRYDIVKDLDIHTLVHRSHRIGREVDFGFLVIFLKLWDVLRDDIFGNTAKRKSLHLHLLEYIVRE